MKKAAILATLFPIFISACATLPQSGSAPPAASGMATTPRASQPAGNTSAIAAATSPNAAQTSILNIRETPRQDIYLGKEQYTVPGQYNSLRLQQAASFNTAKTTTKPPKQRRIGLRRVDSKG